MRIAAFVSMILGAWIAAPAPGVSAATIEQIGSWVLSCPGHAAGTGPCLLRANQQFLGAGFTVDLEVQAQGDALVPVIAMRGPSSEILLAAATLGKTEASLRFAGGRLEELACGPGSAGYFCSPRDDAARRLAAELPRARSVTVRVSVTMSGLPPLPRQERSMDLSGTAEALAKLRKAGAPQVSAVVAGVAPASPGAWVGMADKALKASGYPNGMSDLEALMARYLKKPNEVR